MDIKFDDAFELMEKGEKITLPGATVYWKLVNDRVKAYNIDNNEFDHNVTTSYIITCALKNNAWVVMYNNEEPKEFGFGMALEKLKKGLKVSRKGWNGKNMYIYYEHPSIINISRMSKNIYNPESESETYDGCFVLRYADASFAVWTPSITDLLAEDWYEIVCQDINANNSTVE